MWVKNYWVHKDVEVDIKISGGSISLVQIKLLYEKYHSSYRITKNRSWFQRIYMTWSSSMQKKIMPQQILVYGKVGTISIWRNFSYIRLYLSLLPFPNHGRKFFLSWFAFVEVQLLVQKLSNSISMITMRHPMRCLAHLIRSKQFYRRISQ